MSEDSVLDTTIAEPSPTPDEVETIRFALRRCRATFAWKVGGLDAEALRRPHPPSAMTLGGLVKHLALVEDQYTADFLAGPPMGPPWVRENFEADPDWEWHSAADDTPAELYGLWKAAVARSDVAMDELLADGGLDRPSNRTTSTGEPSNARRGLMDLHEEYARHVGHADLFREAVDGLVGEDPPQA